MSDPIWLSQYVQRRKPIQERFWEKVNILSSDECWIWKAYKTRLGYGKFRIASKLKFSHRVAWEFTFGYIPDGLDVLHRCDNTLCVNPNHLFLGTHTDNMRDMIRKGRQNILHGEAHGNSKLTVKDIIEIRNLYSSGLGCTEISKKFGVTDINIHSIVNRKTWKDVI